jgi:hypothetical protein
MDDDLAERNNTDSSNCTPYTARFNLNYKANLMTSKWTEIIAWLKNIIMPSGLERHTR